jgi:predicted transcriptional regulator
LADKENGLLEMTVGIVANYVSNNRVSPEELAGLVSAVHSSLANVGQPVEEVPAVPERLSPAAIKKLITADGITSLVDGRKFKSLKRHLALNGFTPQAYREHFGLPKDFPMVHPDYAAKRSALAKSMKLGSGGRSRKTAVSSD